MSDIVIYSAAIAALAVEILKYIGIFPLKYIKIVLLVQLLTGAAYCFFALDILSNFKWYLLSAPLIAYGTYLVSLFIVGTKFNKENLMVKRVRFDPKLQPKIKTELLRNLLSSSVEEIVFRAILQFALTRLIGNAYIPAITVCILFTAAHYKKKIAIVQMLDIFFFSIVVSALFAVFTNAIFTILIHIIRNTFVIIQKYIVQQKKIDRFNHIIRIKNKEKTGGNV